MSYLFRELHHALRSSVARPAFSALVVAVLGAGLACVVFMLAFLDGFVLRPLPFAEPEALYQAGIAGDWRLGRISPVADQDLIASRRELAPLADVAGAARSTINVSDLDRPERYNGAHASANLFRVLGVAPLLGRDFTDADEQPGAPSVVMLSFDLWQNRYGGDRAIVGKPIRIDAAPATIVGVMPQDFSFPRREMLWVAATLATRTTPDPYSYWLVLRRHADVGEPAVRSAFAAWFDAAQHADPQRLHDQFAGIEPLSNMVMDATTRAMLGMMLASVFLVLLIACANAANLMLSNALGRRAELAIRAALGASRARLVLQLFAQSALLSLVALAIALPIAQAGLTLQQAALRESEFSLLWLHFELNGHVIALALAATLLTAIASGVLPALLASRAAPADGVRENTARNAGGRGFARVSRALVVGEIALSCALVVCVATLTRGIVALEHTDLGIDTEHLLTARLLLSARTYPTSADQARLYERLGQRLREDPGVLDASVGTALPGTYYNELRDVLPAGSAVDAATPPQTAYAAVDDNFLGAWGVKLQEGRFFDTRDTSDGEHVAVVDRRFVEKFGDGAPLVGRRFRLDPHDAHGVELTIVGVIAPVLLDAPGAPPSPAMLVPLRQAPYKVASVAVRTRAASAAFATRLSELMREVDADTPLYWVRDYDEVRRSMSFGERTVAHSFAAFGAIALLLAGAGLYGVLAFAVGQRTREIGVRRALGARPWPVLRQLFARYALQVLLGLALGVGAGLLFADRLAGALRTIAPGGWPVVATTVAVLVAAALLAVIVPARRALRIDPIAALRHE